MKKVLFITVMMMSVFCFSQTKSETIEWIHRNINYYKKNKLHNPFREECGLDYFEIKNGYIYKEIHYGTIGLNFNCDINSIKDTSIYRVKIADIKEVSIKTRKIEFLGSVSTYIFLELKFDYGKLEFSHNRDPNTHIDKNANDLRLTLEKDVISDNMQERLEKAFVHLIKLHGGTAKVYKEPF